jgi:hypothetical protein
MNRPRLLVLTLVAPATMAFLAGIGPGQAQDGVVDKAKAAAFDNRMFAGSIGEKTHAASSAAMTPIIWRSIPSKRSTR